MAIPLMDPPKDLLKRLETRLHEEERYLHVRRRFVAFLMSLIASAIAFPFAVWAFGAAASASGFQTFLSIAFSEGSVALDHWQEFGYSLLESLPVSALAVLFGTAIVFFISLQFVAKEFRNIWKHLPLQSANR